MFFQMMRPAKPNYIQRFRVIGVVRLNFFIPTTNAWLFYQGTTFYRSLYQSSRTNMERVAFLLAYALRSLSVIGIFIFSSSFIEAGFVLFVIFLKIFNTSFPVLRAVITPVFPCSIAPAFIRTILALAMLRFKYFLAYLTAYFPQARWLSHFTLSGDRQSPIHPP